MKKETDEEVEELEKILQEAADFKPVEKTFWKDKEGNKLTYKQFMKRWEDGCKGITQLQQTSMQLNSMYIMLIGLVCGFVITLFNLENLWWLSIILGAGCFNTGISALGIWQKKVALAEMEKMIMGGKNE